MFVFLRNNPISNSDPSGFRSCVGELTINKTPINFDLDLRDNGNSGFIGAKVDILAEFKKPCCECCEYRQYISAYRKTTSRGLVVPDLDDGIDLCEHGIRFGEDEGDGQRYGHRGEPDRFGRYAIDGCSYKAIDMPGLYGIRDLLRQMRPVSQYRSYSLQNFMVQIIDICNDDAIVKTELFYVEVLVTISVVDFVGQKVLVISRSTS